MQTAESGTQTINPHSIADEQKSLSNEILRLRKETLEINRLLSSPELGFKDLCQVRKLLLQDATDRMDDKVSSNEWVEILRARTVIVPSNERLQLLAHMLSSI